MKKKIIAISLVCVLLFSVGLTGCSLVKVNPEKDNAKVMMTVGEDGKDGQLLKKEYNNAMAYLQMMYMANGTNMPTGKDLDEIKQSVYDEVVQTAILAAKADKDGTKYDKAQAEKDGQKAYETAKKEADKKYETALTAWYSNDEAFKTYMIDNSVRVAASQAALKAYNDKIEKNPDEYLNQKVASYNIAKDDKEIDITKGEFFYYYIIEELNNYMTTQALLETDDKTQKTVNETIADNIATNGALIKYCEENDIKIEQKQIDEQQKTLQSTIDMFFPDETSLNSYLSSYHMNVKSFKKYQALNAKSEAAKAAIEAKAGNDAEVTDKEIESYFNENKNTYDKSTVSACHILTEDKSLANQIATEAKDCKSKADFQKIMDKYQSDEKVQEATDLGSFDRTKMVEEFSNAAFSQDENTVSKPVKTEFGYHVIFVYKKDIKEVKADDHKDEIKKTLQNEKGAEAYEDIEKDITKRLNVPTIDPVKKGTEEFAEQIKEELNIKVNEMSL